MCRIDDQQCASVPLFGLSVARRAARRAAAMRSPSTILSPVGGAVVSPVVREASTGAALLVAGMIKFETLRRRDLAQQHKVMQLFLTIA